MKLTLFRAFGLALSATAATAIFACGGSGSNKVIQGNVSGPIATLSAIHFKNDNGIAGVQVCALGECDITDDNGDFAFSVKEVPGDTLFSFSGGGFSGDVVVGLPSGAALVSVQFMLTQNGLEWALTESEESEEPEMEEPEMEEPEMEEPEMEEPEMEEPEMEEPEMEEPEMEEPEVEAPAEEPTLSPEPTVEAEEPTAVPTEVPVAEPEPTAAPAETATPVPAPEPTATTVPAPEVPDVEIPDDLTCDQCLAGCESQGQPPAVCLQVCTDGFPGLIPPGVCP
jgi:hypothetical protein